MTDPFSAHKYARAWRKADISSAERTEIISRPELTANSTITRMGAVWAALHEGHRGNKYDGPAKSDAIAKLKKLYEREGMKSPGASVGSYVCVCPLWLGEA